jgi:dUTP pyrophosphatase
MGGGLMLDWLFGLFTKTVKVKKLYGDAFVPQYTTEGSAGVDLHAYLPDRVPIGIEPNQRMLIKTGIAVKLPKRHELQVRPRSGHALKAGVTVLNSPGTVDTDYIGEIGVILYNTGNVPFIVNHGDRIAQAVIAKYEKPRFKVVTELEETARGGNGYGSTGK